MCLRSYITYELLKIDKTENDNFYTAPFSNLENIESRNPYFLFTELYSDFYKNFTYVTEVYVSLRVLNSLMEVIN